jgi:hypothetical protein
MTLREAAGTSPEMLLHAMQARRPVKVTGLTAGWDATRWTFDSLREMAGDRKVTALLDLPPAGGVLPGGQQRYEQEMGFAEFLDHAERARSAAPCYLGYTRPEELIPGYADAFDFTPLTPADLYGTDTRLWIGSGGTCSGLHSDLKDNVFAQIYGRKRVILVPFAQTPLVYPFRDNIANSQVNPELVDPARFPKFQRARVYDTVVGPGDVLYIPRGWWHYLRSESPSISINHWFGPQIPAHVFLGLVLRLGPQYIGRTLTDLIRYSMLRRSYRKDFFFTPPSTGERLFNLIRHGNFSRENDPTLKAK